MAEATGIGASVEGEKVDLHTRQFFHYPPKRRPGTKTSLYLFKLGIRGTATITEAYATAAEACEYSSSMLCVGDSIAGQSITGWAKKPLGKPNVTMGSGTHNESQLSISGGCFASVEISPREHLQSPEIQKRNPPVVMTLRQTPPPS